MHETVGWCIQAARLVKLVGWDLKSTRPTINSVSIFHNSAFSMFADSFDKDRRRASTLPRELFKKSKNAHVYDIGIVYTRMFAVDTSVLIEPNVESVHEHADTTYQLSRAEACFIDYIRLSRWELKEGWWLGGWLVVGCRLSASGQRLEPLLQDPESRQARVRYS